MTTELRGVAEFNQGFREWARIKPREAVVDRQKFLATDFFGRVIFRSPVGTPESTGIKGYAGGRYRGNHRVAIGQELSGELEVNDPSGHATQQAGYAMIGQLDPRKPFTYVWIGNTARHAGPLERGWSVKQAPQGIYVISFNETAVLVLGGGGR